MATKVTRNLLTVANKGGMLVGDGSGVVVELAVGSNDQILKADSTQTGGVKWASGGGSGSM